MSKIRAKIGAKLRAKRAGEKVAVSAAPEKPAAVEPAARRKAK